MASPPKVAVVGCGPGGMFFCHAIETYRRELLEEGDEAGIAALPSITCFERASGPGGVWRAKRSFADAVDTEDEKKTCDMGVETATETTNMYEALWLNGSKEPIEFFDYTFDEHFGCALPVYLPRQPYLEYMLGRVTKHCPDFFEKYVNFNTSVVSVKYNETKGKFEIVTENSVTHEVTTHDYDKCIWAAGQNGKPKVPTAMISMFKEGGFSGRMIHSTDTANFEADVKGKRLLLIGGNYSAEDLALMAIKLGTKKVYINSRTDCNAVTWTSSWPMNMVELLLSQTPVNVTENGRCIQFAKTEFSFPDNYTAADEEIVTEIRDIDTIIFCTGYSANLDMLHAELRAPFTEDCMKQRMVVPADWKMKPNEMTDMVGDIEPDEVTWPYIGVRYPDLYRGVVISNPSMMFLEHDWFPFPIAGIDVNAWMLMRFLTNTKLPTAAEMRKRNLEDALDQLQIPYVRYCVDRNFQDAYWATLDPGGHDLVYYDRLYYKSYPDYKLMHFRVCARTMQEARYPVSYGTYENPNEIVTKILEASSWGYYHRAELDPTNEEENFWRTFRDVKNPERHCSIFTGIPSVPLKGKWIDLDASDESILKQSDPQPENA